MTNTLSRRVLEYTNISKFSEGFPKLSLIIALLSFSIFSFSQTNTTASGDWQNGANWDSGVPGSSDDATVNHVMTINGDHTCDGATWVVNSNTTDAPGGGSYKCEIKGFGNYTVNADVTYEGPLKLSNDAIITVTGCNTLTVGGAEFENDSDIIVAACATLIINGDLLLKNNNGMDVEGDVIVNGNVLAENNASLTGSGSLSATGTVNISDAATLFGSSTPCTVAPCGFGSSPLPIELVDFNAMVNDRVVEVSWTTASEINNDYFVIERSQDGVVWEKIISSTGAGSSSTIISYLEIDSEPLFGLSYYRISQVDFNGEIEMFNIVPVEIVIINNKVMSVFPNPTRKGDQINISFKDLNKDSGGSNEVLVVLRDIMGTEVYSKVEFVDSRDGLVAIDKTHNLVPGTYLVIASSEQGLYSQRILIKE